MLAHAEPDLHRCLVCEAEESRADNRRRQKGSMAGLFVRWFPKGGPKILHYLSGDVEEGADG
jgi:hypothetical protein